MDAEEVGVGCCGFVRIGGIEGGAGDDEDGAVDEESEGEEGGGEFDDGVFEAGADGADGGFVFGVEVCEIVGF